MLLAYKKRRERYAVAVTVTAWVGCISYIVFLLLASLLYELQGEELPMPYLPFATAGTLALAIFCFFLYFRCNRIKARGERRFHEGEARLLRKWSRSGWAGSPRRNPCYFNTRCVLSFRQYDN